MTFWLSSLIALIAVVVLAPTLAWLGRRYGARAKGGLVLASVLLGLGVVVDPPGKPAVEAAERKKTSPDNGEPPFLDP